jgi:hypothetical protein
LRAFQNVQNTLKTQLKPEAKEGPLEEDGDHESRDNEIIYARFLCNNIQGNNRVQKPIVKRYKESVL